MASYYEILGVEADADDDAITEAYAAALRAAPTADGGPGAHVRKLDEAYAVIGHADRRRRYDLLRAADDGDGNPELLALLSVIAETGRLPAADTSSRPPVDPRPAPPDPPRPAAPHASQAEPTPRPSQPAPAQPGPAQAEPPRPEPAEPESQPEAEPEPQPESKPEPSQHTSHAEPDPPRTDEWADRPSTSSVAGPPPRRAHARRAHTRRAGRRVPGTDVSRRGLGRRRTMVAGALVGLLIGVGAGVVAAGDGEEALVIEEGACVSLGAEEGRAVDCGSADAVAVVAELADDPGGCQPSPTGHLVLADGRVACLAPR